jgi:hypothetical protein
MLGRDVLVGAAAAYLMPPARNMAEKVKNKTLLP